MLSVGNIKPNAHNLIVATLLVSIGFAIIVAASKTRIANWPVFGSLIKFVTSANRG